MVEFLLTPQVVKAAQEAHKYNTNRQATDAFIEGLDPEGIHLVAFRMQHNDVEWRFRLLAKMQDRDDPSEVWLDIPMDSTVEFLNPAELAKLLDIPLADLTKQAL